MGTIPRFTFFQPIKMQKTTVVSVKKAELGKRGYKDFTQWKESPNTVYIGRNMSYYVPGATGSIWQNPFPVKKHGLEECLRLFEQYIRDKPELLAQIHTLEGKELGCWCKPDACHGDVLVKLLQEHKGVSAATTTTTASTAAQPSSASTATAPTAAAITSAAKQQPAAASAPPALKLEECPSLGAAVTGGGVGDGGKPKAKRWAKKA
eukprot:GDKI01028054.1.p1 GENE.GDKI01028054.1~~GDKI01028054.1.p1  ORF type:complete len:207 (-),score=43.12 GDKI01028054.1:279-899(-)